MKQTPEFTTLPTTAAMLERQSAPTLLITTRECRDALQVAQQVAQQQQLHRGEHQIVVPELPYARVINAIERVSADGEVLEPLDEMHLRERLWAAFDAGLRRADVVFMHSHRFPAHELAAQRLALEAGFTQVSVSHQVSP